MNLDKLKDAINIRSVSVFRNSLAHTRMARHNREGGGTDQHEKQYRISFQPDWLRFVKVSRQLDSGRQSTKTLFRNPAARQEALPGDRVRTRIVSAEQGLDFEVAVTDPHRAIKRIRVSYELPGDRGEPPEEVEFTLESDLPPPLE